MGVAQWTQSWSAFFFHPFKGCDQKLQGKMSRVPPYLFHCSLLSLSDLIWVGWEIYEVYRLHPSFISGCTLIAWVGGVSHSYVDRGSNFQNFQSCHPPSRMGHDQNNSTNPLYLRKYFCFCKHCVTFNSSFDTAFWLILSFISTKKHVTIVWFIIFVSWFSLWFSIPRLVLHASKALDIWTDLSFLNAVCLR